MFARALPRGALRRVVADLHLWLSLAVGVQVFLWIASGLFMALQPIEKVRSEHRLADVATGDLRSLGPFVSTDAALDAAGDSLKRLSLEIVAGRPVFVGETAAGERMLVDAKSGRLLSPIDQGFAQAIAEQAMAGEDRASRVRWIADHPPIEYRGALPVWRVDFDDADRLSVYVSPQSGQILARRSELWRVYDFFWSLHIMDYRDRENFNHPMLIAFAASALVMALSGLVLLALRLPQRLRGRRRLKRRIRG